MTTNQPANLNVQGTYSIDIYETRSYTAIVQASSLREAHEQAMASHDRGETIPIQTEIDDVIVRWNDGPLRHRYEGSASLPNEDEEIRENIETFHRPHPDDNQPDQQHGQLSN